MLHSSNRPILGKNQVRNKILPFSEALACTVRADTKVKFHFSEFRLFFVRGQAEVKFDFFFRGNLVWLSQFSRKLRWIAKLNFPCEKKVKYDFSLSVAIAELSITTSVLVNEIL